MFHTYVFYALYCFLLALSGCSLSKNNVRDASKINADSFKKHVKYLSSDDLEGRYTGSRGQKKAARYIADHYQKYGLAGVGDHGTYFQKFVLYRDVVDTLGSLIFKNETSLDFLKDFLVLGYTKRGVAMKKNQDSLEDIYFAGFGIQTDLYQSYVTEDIKGKHVFVLHPNSSELAKFNHGEDVSYVISDVVNDLLKNGAQGVIVSVPDNVYNSSKKDVLHHLKLDNARFRLPFKKEDKEKKIVLIRQEVESKVLQSMGMSQMIRDSLVKKPKSSVVKDLGWKFDVGVALRDSVLTENVCGFLEGDTDDIVVLTAHYDHLGIKQGEIYNGADDNASGISTLLVMAKHFSESNRKPKKGILFLSVSAEELGLLGSSHYTDFQPLFPLEKTKVNVNVDMIGRVDSIYIKKKDQDYIYIVGSDRITQELDIEVKKANAMSEKLKLDYTYNEIGHPLNIYRRSDHYNFAKHGIPSVFFFSGLHEDYHKPTDDYEKIDFERLARVARVIYTLTWNLTDREEPLILKAGSN